MINFKIQLHLDVFKVGLIFVDYHLLFLAGFFFIYVACVVKVTHLSAAPSQEVPSLDWSVHSFMSHVLSPWHTLNVHSLIHKSFFCHLHVYHTRIHRTRLFRIRIPYVLSIRQLL